MTYYTWPMFTYGVDSTHFAEMQLVAERLKLAEEEISRKESTGKEKKDDPHLRSIKEVNGYSIHALDGSIGHVEDFIFEDSTWIIRYMIVDTRNFLPGRNVLISPEWIKNVDWSNKGVSVNMTCDSIKNSPEFDPTAPVNRTYELKLYDFYGRPTYWDNHQ